MEEPNMFKTAFGKRYMAAMLIFGILGLSFGAPAYSKQRRETEAQTNYSVTRQEILQFEAVINDVITRTFSSSPFAVVQKAKGAYLQGYGVSFSFLINIHRAVINTPFGQVRKFPQTDITPELKRQRIEELKETLIRMLQNNGEMFRQLRKEDYVTIIAFFEDRNFPDEPSANRTIVLSALKKDLDELAHKSDRLREFKQRMKIVEY